MADTRKNKSAKIQQCVAQSDFDAAAELCQSYLKDYPDDLKIWWNYILADYKVTGAKELAKRNVDITINPIFSEAVSSLSAEKGNQLYDMVERIEKHRKNNAGSTDYKSCKNYFIRSINEVKSEMETVQAEMSATIEESKSVFKNVSKKSVKLYGNNIITFFMSAILLLLPFAILSVFMRIKELSTFVSFIPIIVGIIILIAALVRRLIKYRKFTKEFAGMSEQCTLAEMRIVELNKTYKLLKFKKKRMMAIFKNLKKDPNMSERRVAKLMAEFDKINSAEISVGE